MAKKQTDALATLEPKAAMAVSATADGRDFRGKEAIEQGDTALPRVAICQELSPQKQEDDGAYIEGLRAGDLFNVLSGEIYEQPLKVAIVKLEKRAMEFAPRDSGGGVVDYDVPWSDPRCEFTTDKDGNRQAPIATRFYDYLAIIPGTLEMVVLSLKGTQIKVAKRLNSFITTRPGATWAGLYSLTTRTERNKKNEPYKNFTILPAGPTDAVTEQYASEVYENVKHTRLKVDVKSAEPATEDAPF